MLSMPKIGKPFGWIDALLSETVLENVLKDDIYDILVILDE